MTTKLSDRLAVAGVSGNLLEEVRRIEQANERRLRILDLVQAGLQDLRLQIVSLGFDNHALRNELAECRERLGKYE